MPYTSSPRTDHLRICIVAEHASMRFGGEAILPVHYFRLLRSREIECWLVVHSRTRRELEELFPRDLDRLLFVPDLWIHKLISSLSSHLPRRISEATLGLFNQLVTQFFQRTIIRRLIAKKQINVIHQPIPVGPRFPSLFFGLGIPRVVGPLNGGMGFPPAFRNSESKLTRAAVAVMRLLSDFANTLLPGKKRADIVLVANHRTRGALPSRMRGTVIELAENGIEIESWQDLPCKIENTMPRFVFVGRLIDLKAVDIVIRSLEKVPTAELEIIGDGPMLERWESLACEIGLKDRVHFAGWLSQQECAVRLRSAVALLMPSLCECGGAVVLEAMAMGRPVIATNWGGPADYLDTTCGILVEPKNYSHMVAGFAEAMQMLILNPRLARSMGEAGRARVVAKYDWQRKIDRIIEIYSALLEKSNLALKNERDRVIPVALRETATPSAKDYEMRTSG